MSLLDYIEQNEVQEMPPRLKGADLHRAITNRDVDASEPLSNFTSTKDLFFLSITIKSNLVLLPNFTSRWHFMSLVLHEKSYLVCV